MQASDTWSFQALKLFRLPLFKYVVSAPKIAFLHWISKFVCKSGTLSVYFLEIYMLPKGRTRQKICSLNKFCFNSRQFLFLVDRSYTLILL